MAVNFSYKDQVLLERIAEGDEQAFAVIYNELVPVIHAFLLKMLKSEALVQDAVQETFIRIWMNRDKLPGIEAPKAWVARIALNECYRILRKQALLRSRESGLQAEEFHDSGGAADRLAFAETKQTILRVIEELPERRKLIFRLSREQGLKIPEIATMLGLSPGYVKNALVLALKQLRERLSEEGMALLVLYFFKKF